MPEHQLDRLRRELVDINFAILNLLNRRAATVIEVQKVKHSEGIPIHIPEREQQMLEQLVADNKGPFSGNAVRHLFQEVFRASVALMESQSEEGMKISRTAKRGDLRITLGEHVIGDEPILIAGPCAVESESQMEMVAADLANLGINFLRGGTFKPRSSPYSFQGMGEEGLKILQSVAKQNNMISVTEVMDTRDVDMVAGYADILQIGSRNMHNYALLREVGRCDKPVLLKRGLAATLDEFLWAAEYIVSEGNEQVILCERGIRTFERQTRNTLDISAIPLLRAKTYLPVIADISHAAGRKDILPALAKAVLAAGANGVMVEVHPFPAVARSDGQQQLDIDEFRAFLKEIDMAPPDALMDESAHKEKQHEAERGLHL